MFVSSLLAVLLFGGLAPAANPATFNRTSPGSANITATQGGSSVTWNFAAVQQWYGAQTNGTFVANPSGDYSGAVMVRCNGSPTILTSNFAKPQTTATVGCWFDVGNAWAAILWSY